MNTAADVASRIGKTERWVKRHARELPHHRFGRTYVFSDQDVADILAAHRHAPEPAAPADELRPVGRTRRAS
jgi:hypothetical protein